MTLAHWTLALIAITYLVGWSPAFAQESQRIEVIEVKGIIDGSVERAVLSTIEQAEREDALLVVLQIDSRGVVDSARTWRLAEAVRVARVPVAAWIGPPGAEASNGAALLVAAAHVPGISPLSRLGRIDTLDLRERQQVTLANFEEADWATNVFFGRTRGFVRAASVAELLEDVDGRRVDVSGAPARLGTEPSDVAIRFHKLDLLGRVLHAAAQPSITYLLLLLGLVGVVFELFHPSTGPAGVAGLAAMALAVYGVVTLGGSWLGFGLIVAGVAGFAVDLRFQGLGPPTIAGFGALVAGSLLLFSGPWLHVSPWILGFGIAGMVAFLLGAMTRVLRDLRALARGELEVHDAHPHPNGDH